MTMDFSQALESLKDGSRVSRIGWNGKGMYLYIPGRAERGHFEQFIAMKTADDKLVPWLASQTDILAEDWQAHVV